MKQTKKLAETLLRNGMLKGSAAGEVERVAQALGSRDTYFSHGSVIDHREATQLNLEIQYLPPGDAPWERIWPPHSMYDFDVRRDNYLKIFEGRARGTAIGAPPK